jgi:hypothetical protein
LTRWLQLRPLCARARQTSHERGPSVRLYSRHQGASKPLLSFGAPSADSPFLASLPLSRSPPLTSPSQQLGDHFKKVANFQKRFKTIPEMVELDHLTVAGDVSFGRKVILRGTVIIVANEGSKIELPDGTILENKLVSGESGLWSWRRRRRRKGERAIC